MAILDQALLSELQRVTLEHQGDGGSSWPSGMWSRDEVLDACNDRQREFLVATGLVWMIATPAVVLGVNAQPNPADWMSTVFLTYRTPAGLYREVPKLDAYELDLGLPAWPGATTPDPPRGYYEIDGDTTTTYLVPAPTAAGSALEWFYLGLGTLLTANGVTFTVPDDFVPTIKYGVLADLFGKVGQAFNPVLRDAAEARWEEGIQLGILMSKEGWFAL